MSPRPWELLTAWKKDKFKLLDQEDLDYFQVAKEYLQPLDYRKQNKGILLSLQLVTNPEEELIFANTQLYHGSEHDYVRYAQALFLMKHANAMMLKRILNKAKWTKDMPNAIKRKAMLAQGSLPFVMGCDLNSPPDCAAFELLMS